MYASRRSVNANTNKVLTRKKQAAFNEYVHRGYQHYFVQITPDGKHIQHYRMTASHKAIKDAVAKAFEQKAKEDAEVTEKAADEQ